MQRRTRARAQITTRQRTAPFLARAVHESPLPTQPVVQPHRATGTSLHGTRIASANATSCTTPSGNWYVAAHTVRQGSTSSVNSCATDYTISGTAATNHDDVSDCKVTCAAGEYVPTAGGGCKSVGSGYYTSSSQTVAQNATSSRSACSALTGVSVTGGTYSSVSPFNAATTCRYKAPNRVRDGWYIFICVTV